MKFAQRRRPEVVVRELEETQLEDACGVLAETFAEETLFATLLGTDLPTRARLLRHFMRGMMRGHRSFAALDGAFVDGQLAAVAISIPPDRFPIAGRDMLRIATSTLPGALRIALTAPGILRLLKGAGVMERHHPRDAPCWYLAFFGARREFRRYGVARDLARTVLDRADAAGVGCYLDTAGKNTKRMCHALGFRVRNELHPFPDGPTCWGMWREPRK